MTPLAYAGIGSRSTPEPICALITRVAAALARRGWLLRSGGAIGADRAFELGATKAGGACEIYRPDRARTPTEIAAPHLPTFPQALELAAQHHPYWASLAPYVRALHARNGFQVLGRDLASPVRFVLCWTPQFSLGPNDEITAVSGGTGQAVRVALANSVPVFHLGHPPHRERIGQMLEGAA